MGEGRCVNRADARRLLHHFVKDEGEREKGGDGYKVDITEKGKETNPARSWKRWEGQRIRPE